MNPEAFGGDCDVSTEVHPWIKRYYPVDDAENKGNYACVGGGLYRKSLHLLPNFVANLKLLSRIKSLF